MSNISGEYAKALFMLAIENDKKEDYKESVDLISEVFSKNPEYIQFLASPSIKLKERLKALDDAFLNKIEKEVLYFVKILCGKGDIAKYFECAQQFEAMLDEMKNVSNAKVISAVELDSKAKSKLMEKLEKISGRTVIPEYTVDKSILGGLIVEIDGKVLNLSLQKHLKDIKDVIS